MRIGRWIGLAAAVLVLAGLILFGRGYREAVSQPVLRTAQIGMSDWPARARPIRVALLSDIHIGGLTMDAARLTRIVEAVDAQQPDLVLLAGDFVVGHDGADADGLAEQLVVPLSRLRAPLGVFAVLGNHDHWTRPDAIVRALSESGIATLSNRSIVRGPITLVGIDDAFSGHADVRRALDGAVPGRPLLAFSHAPQVIDGLAPGQLPLLLAGHTHCGQVVLPTGRGLIETSPYSGERLYDPRYRCGIVHAGGRTVLVTAGVGSGSVPVRLGAPPDWWLVTLGPKPR